MMLCGNYYLPFAAWRTSLLNIYDYSFDSEVAHLPVYSQLTVSEGFGKQNNQILFKFLAQ